MRPFLLSLVLCLWSVGAHAQQPQIKCLAQEEMEQTLKNEYNEQVVGRGMSLGGRVLVEIYAEKEGKTFSIVYTAPNEGEITSCLIGAGQDWMELEASSSKLGDPS